MVVPVDLLRRAATDTGGDRDRSAPKLRHARREHRVTASRTKRLTRRPRTQSCHLGFDRVGIAAYPYLHRGFALRVRGMAASHVSALKWGCCPRAWGERSSERASSEPGQHSGSVRSERIFEQALGCSVSCAGTFHRRTVGGRHRGRVEGAIASPAVRFMSDNPPPCGLGDDSAGTLGTMSLDMTPQTQRQRVAQTKCNLCSREIDAQLAERWYWQSDGGPGLFVLCPDCAKNWHHTQR